MDLRTREAVRYLGYGSNAADEKTLEMISDSFKELETVASPKSICRIFQLHFEEPKFLTIGNMKIESNNLSKNMKGCTETAVFGATLGVGVDVLMKRYTLTEMSKAVVLQACAAALLEEYCDDCQETLRTEQEACGKYLRPRFSPGYGDFSIRHQEELLTMLQAPKLIGLTMTNGSMLTPLKSVTAVIGISTTKEPCHKKGCEECTKTDCLYRRS